MLTKEQEAFVEGFRISAEGFNGEYMGTAKEASVMSDEELFKELEKYYNLK